MEGVSPLPSRPKTPCRHPGCPALVPYGWQDFEAHKSLHPEATPVSRETWVREQVAEGKQEFMNR